MSVPELDSALCRAATPRLHSLQLLLLDCVRFSCCLPLAASAAAPRLRPLQLLLATCVHFSCYSPIASASTAPRLHLLQCSPFASTLAAAPRLCPLQLLLPDCVHFSCCSPIASQLFWKIPAHAQYSLRSSRFSKLKYEGCVSLVLSILMEVLPLPMQRKHLHQN